jgi:small subunit ribosomal protein S4
MSKNVAKKVKSSSKYKVTRRLMTTIWDTPKDTFSIRNTKPGQHGSSSGFRMSDYGVHLKEKQKLKAHYGKLREQHMKIAFEKAGKMKGNVAENFISLLERKLFVVVYRLNFAPTIFGARQLVSHKHILVNGKAVNIASYLLSKDDKISLSEKAQNFKFCVDNISNAVRPIPEYLQLDKKNKEGTLISEQLDVSAVPFPFALDMNLIVEFYSR